MLLRCDATIATGLLVCGNSSVGVLAENIPSAGAHGASPLYNDLSLPADNGSYVRMYITSFPASGTLECDEYGRLTFTNTDGSYQALYQLYVDGVAVGSPTTIDLAIGVGAIDLTINDTEVAAELDQPTLTRGRTLTVQGLEVVTEFDQPSISKSAGLNVADLEISPETDNVNVGVGLGISLTIQDIQITPESDNIQIARGLALNPANIEITPEFDRPGVGKEITLNIADSEIQPESDNVAVVVSTGITLNIAPLEIAPELGGDLNIGRGRLLAPDDLEIAPELELIDIGLNIVLAIDDIDVQPETQHFAIALPGSQVYGSTHNVMILTPETQIMVVT